MEKLPTYIDEDGHRVIRCPTKIAKGVERRHLLPSLRQRKSKPKRRGVRRMNAREMAFRHMKKVLDDNQLTAETAAELVDGNVTESQLARAKIQVQKHVDRFELRIQKMEQKAKERAEKRAQRKKEKEAEKAKAEKSAGSKKTTKKESGKSTSKSATKKDTKSGSAKKTAKSAPAKKKGGTKKKS